jgi:hypothetical protein
LDEEKKRFFDKVDKSGDGGCWIWTAGKSRGYGRFKLGDSVTLAHRVSYTWCKGEIPDGLILDHLCRNRACVNPDHLEPVTYQVNLLRGDTISAMHAKKTHCPQGHEYTDENTYMYRGSRQCSTCRKIQNDKFNARRKQLAKEVGEVAE